MDIDVIIEMEPDRDLKSEVCSVKLEDEPMVPVKNSTAPLTGVAPIPSELVSDLPMPRCWEPVRERKAVRVLAKPLD